MPSELRALLRAEPPEALALALALGAPAEPVLRWVDRAAAACALEISGDDLLAAGVPEAARRSGGRWRRRCGASSTASSTAATRSCAPPLELARG